MDLICIQCAAMSARFDMQGENVIETCPGRQPTNNEKLYRWSSWQPKTPFAPTWDCPMYMDTVDSALCNTILTGLTKIEEKIGHWTTYNFFLTDDPIALQLKKRIKESLYEFGDEIKITFSDQLCIRGWMHCTKIGEKLPIHSHSMHENTFLSGNLLLHNSNIQTEYIIPHYSTYCGNFKPEAKCGKMLWFPSWVEHYVPECNENRYSIAWDIYTNEAMEYMAENHPEDSMSLSCLL